MLSRLASARAFLLTALFPRSCACGAEGAYICDACRSAITPVAVDVPGLDLAVAGGDYRGPIGPAIVAFKYGFVSDMAGELGVLTAAAIPLAARDWTLVPVPLHPRRKAWRGFDQALALAEAVGMAAGMEVDSCLARTRETRQQASLHADARRANVAGAFVASSSHARVLLVDDVLTTGSTAVACADALRAAGSATVGLLAAAVELA